MRTPDQVRDKIRTRWDRQWPDWLGGGGAWPLTFALDPPVERDARAAWPQFQAWLAAWAAAPLGGRLRLQEVRWSSLGAQQLPSHVEFDGPSSVAGALGEKTARRFAVAEGRWTVACARRPELVEALRRQAGYLADLPAEDFERFLSVLDWLVAHPGSGLFVRQIPVAGIHSKWIEANSVPLAQLLAAHRGMPPDSSLARVAGLATDPARRRIRLLDPELRAAVGGLADVSLPLPALTALGLRPKVVLIVENNQTALACQDLPGTLLIFGGGFAVSELASVQWLADARIVYWGDIDTAGFAILNALRAHWDHAESWAMDEQTLAEFIELRSNDTVPLRRDLPYLSSEESEIYLGLVDGRWGLALRIEQERLPWDVMWSRLHQRIMETGLRT
jgi:hypothetical protein